MEEGGEIRRQGGECVVHGIYTLTAPLGERQHEPSRGKEKAVMLPVSRRPPLGPAVADALAVPS